MGLNQQLYDMGLPVSDLHRVDHINDMIARADMDFGFVMISDKFEESLVLLADLLCWPLEYVTAFKINARKDTVQVRNRSERCWRAIISSFTLNCVQGY